MKLSEEDAKLFFDLMWGLQYFVNQKYKINHNIKSLAEYAGCSTEEKLEVREVLYSDIPFQSTVAWLPEAFLF